MTKKQLIDLLREMFKAEDAYGCGFYGQDDWVKPYNALRAEVEKQRLATKPD